MKTPIFRAGLASLVFLVSAAAASVEPQAGSEEIFARIDDLVISQEEFEQIFSAAVRHKYYHGRVPEEELAAFREQVSDDIVTQVLVHREARRLGLQPDRKRIDEGLDAFELRNAGNPDWQERRERILPLLVKRLERQDLLEQMERRIRDIPPPAGDAVRRFYEQNPDKFTEPRRLRLSVILLPVSPSAGEEVWLAAEQQAAELGRRIKSGEGFDTLARQYSAHISAASGGDLGFLHDGVLEDVVQQRVAELSPGDLTAPIRVLEGVTLFRLEALQPERLGSFEQVSERAAGLLHRELQDAAWNDFVADLRAAAQIYVNR